MSANFEKAMDRLEAAVIKHMDEYNALVEALEDLVKRCDGEEGVRADGSNIDTAWAHSVLRHVHASRDEVES